MLGPPSQADSAAPIHWWSGAAARDSVKDGLELAPTDTVGLSTENISPVSRTVAERIIAAVFAMTDEVYDTFQIRSVALRANVSPSTLYRYFPSKDALLVAGLDLWLARFVSDVEGEFTLISTPLGRLRYLTARITSELRRHPLLADAFVRAYLLCTPTHWEPDMVRDSVSRAFAHALGPASTHRTAVSDLVTDIWGANIPAIIQDRISVDDLQERLERTVRAMKIVEASYTCEEAG